MKFILFLILLAPLLISAQVFPDKPVNYITDIVNVISEEQELSLNKKLHRFQDSNSTQLFVYVANSLDGADIVELSQSIFSKWDIGQKGKNNGVLTSIFVNDHKFRIHTGCGMEGVLPDVLTKRIQDEKMRPLFKQNNYYEGIDAGLTDLIYYSQHEYKAEPIVAEDPFWGFVIFYFLSVIIYGLLFLLLHFAYKENRVLKISLLVIGAVIALIPVFGFFILFFGLIIISIITLVRKLSKTSNTWSAGSRGTTFFGSTWINSSSSDSLSSWSSGSDSGSGSGSGSGSSFSGGGGGESGGGGNSSDW